MNLIKSIFNLFVRIYQDKKLILVFVFCFSILVSLAFLFFLYNVGPEEHKIPGTDYLDHYRPVGKSISYGEGIPVEKRIIEENTEKTNQGGKIPIDELISFRYPIGYPFILSILFYISNLFNIEELKLIVIFNVLITALTVSFFFLFVKSILNKKIALIAACLWASYPLNLWFMKNPNTEIPFILFLYLALWIYVLAVKKRSVRLFLITGVLIGFMSLTRAISIFFPIPLIFLTFFLVKKSSFRQKLLFSFILIIAYIIVISPWMIYIYLNTGKIMPLASQGNVAISGGLTLMVDNVNENSLIILPEDVVNLVNRSRTAEMNNIINISTFFLEELKNQPITLLKLIAIKMTRSWYATSQMWWEKEILLLQLFYLIPGIIGIVIWFKRFKQKILYLIFLIMVIFYFWAATIVAVSMLRYMIPAMAIFMVFSAITINTIINKLVKSKQNGT